MNLFKLLELELLTESTFRLRAERPQAAIKAGQCFNVGLPGMGVNREYSMYSAADAPYLDFLIKEVEGGFVSPALKKLQPGDKIEIDGPYGEFCLKEPIDERQHYLFLGTGTGIAPFHSFASSYPNLNYTIIHGIRNQNEQYGAKDFAPGCYIPCISKNNPGQPSQRLTDYLVEHPAQKDSIVYLCGNRNMIIDAFEILRNQDVPGNNLFTEVFF
ncbi:MAG: FAD-binding oxidoreductase [Burkholderiales bacterium]